MTEYIDRMPTMTEYAAGKRIDPKLTDLIRRADAIEAVMKHKMPFSIQQEVAREINALPSADAVQGEWIDKIIHCNPYPPVFCVECSRCGYRVGRETFLENTFNYCPNCGAIMKGGAE